MQVALGLVLVCALALAGLARDTCESEDCMPDASPDTAAPVAGHEEECHVAAEDSGQIAQEKTGDIAVDGSSSNNTEQQRESNLNIPLILVLTALFVLLNVFKVSFPSSSFPTARINTLLHVTMPTTNVH